jgi:hypothetical protein
MALQEQADVLPDGAVDLAPEATNQPQAATLCLEGMLVCKRGIDGAESLPVKKSKRKVKALDKDGDKMLMLDHCHLSCVLQEFNVPGDHGYKSNEYSSLSDAANHVTLVELSAIGQVEHRCLGLPPDQLPPDFVLPFSEQTGECIFHSTPRQL